MRYQLVDDMGVILERDTLKGITEVGKRVSLTAFKWNQPRIIDTEKNQTAYIDWDKIR